MSERLIQLDDIYNIDSPEKIAELFQKLGYRTVTKPQPLCVEDLELPHRSRQSIQEAYLIVNYQTDNQVLQVLLFHLFKDEFATDVIAKKRMQAIANSLCNRPAKYLLIGTIDYQNFLFVSPYRQLGKKFNLITSIEICWLNCKLPTFSSCNWLEKLFLKNVSPDHIHQIHQQTFKNAAAYQQKKENLTEDLISLYLKDIGRIQLLTAVEEIELTRKISQYLELKNVRQELKRQLGREPTNREWSAATDIPLLAYRIGREARNKLVAANLRLVVFIAKKYQGRGVDLLDLIQEGSLGLVRAAEKFDIERGHRFTTYATHWVHQGCTRAIANNSRLIRLPVHVYEKLTNIKQVAKQLTQQLRRSPNEVELATQSGMRVTQLKQLLKAAQLPVSLDISSTEDEDSTLINRIVASSLEPMEWVNQIYTKQQIEEIMTNTLSLREQNVIKLRFGWDIEEEMTLEAIGQIYNITRERVRQIEKKALTKLRSKRDLCSLKTDAFIKI